MKHHYILKEEELHSLAECYVTSHIFWKRTLRQKNKHVRQEAKVNSDWCGEGSFFFQDFPSGTKPKSKVAGAGGKAGLNFVY